MDASSAHMTGHFYPEQRDKNPFARACTYQGAEAHPSTTGYTSKPIDRISATALLLVTAPGRSL